MAEPGRLSGGDLGSREEQLDSSVPPPPKSFDAVEMDNLSPNTKAEIDAATATGAASPSQHTHTIHDADSSQIPLPDKNGSLDTSPTTNDAEGAAHPSAKALGKAPATTNEYSDQDAIGPADSTQEPAIPGELTVDVMIIIPSTGNRHPFRINEKYLKKRNVNVTGVTEDGKMDPFSITVYTLKELVLREWRKEWETPPREPTSIRLIKMGKMLDDKTSLSRRDTRTCNHCSITR